MGLDEYKQMTPVEGLPIDTHTEVCAECGDQIQWYEAQDRRVEVYIIIKGTNTRFKVTQYRCKNCQK